MASIAATGYGLAALPIAVENGMVERREAEKMALETLRYVDSITPERYRGWIPHFVDAETGQSFPSSEVSTIDTVLFHAGAIAAAEYFGGEVKDLQREMFGKLDFRMMLTNDGARPDKLTFSHGFHDVGGSIVFLRSEWDAFSEGILLSLLALSDSSIPVESWEKGWDRSKRWEVAGIKNFEALPLFTYYYPLGFLDLRGKADSRGDNFWEAAEKAVQMQMAWCEENGYPESFFGITACDGPNGYRAYYPGHPFGDNTVAPLAMIAATPLNPAAGESALRALERLGLLDGALGPVAAFDVSSGWTAPDTLGIDVGSTLLMIDLQRKGLIHSMFSKNDAVKKAMERAGFVDVH